MTEKNLNEVDEWWLGFLADQTEQARAHAERMFRRNADKKEMRKKIQENNGKMFTDEQGEVTDEWTYAMWWAEWSAKNTLGSDCWY